MAEKREQEQTMITHQVFIKEGLNETQLADSIARQIRAAQSKKQDTCFELKALGPAIKQCLSVALEVRKKFKQGLH